MSIWPTLTPSLSIYWSHHCCCVSFLDSEHFCTELSIMYSNESFNSVTAGSALPLLYFISENNLMETFSGCSEVLKIIITIPVTTEAERCFFPLKCLKTFIRNTVSKDKCPHLPCFPLRETSF